MNDLQKKTIQILGCQTGGYVIKDLNKKKILNFEKYIFSSIKLHV